ncbi:malate dehydrogenase (Oxaloacetate-decarboxylating) (NADP(+)) [Firmicutes bacterium CAG:552]|nr:malate dehydrogenase (Oxaloacetate-decarboxylating) (NADP(+)) [Firmicutes bacterium CAG:552]
MDYMQIALQKHEEWNGKLEVVSRVPLQTKEDLSTAYTPGVAAPCLEIAKDPEKAYVYTRKNNLVAVVSDGSAVLGLGNIGGLAGMPVMEGKSILFKKFGGVDAFPICLDTQDTQEIIDTVTNIAPCFGGINLEDISAPRCFEIEKALIERLNIPVFHDDQHGTAIVVLAAVVNSLKIVGKELAKVRICISGAGAAGSAICRLLLAAGAEDIVVTCSKGVIYNGMEGLDPFKKELSTLINHRGVKGGLKEAIQGCDVFIGVSKAGLLTGEMVESMAKDAIIFAMANPTPEIFPDEAKKHGAKVVGTGRSDYPNQINNVLVFPGFFRGVLDARVTKITERMKINAAYALAALVKDDELSSDYVLPGAFDKRVASAIAQSVMQTAKES